jgi:hypothetical protein
MATDLVPGNANLADALAAVEAAYDRLNAGGGGAELQRLHDCAEELARATQTTTPQSRVSQRAIRLDEPWTLPERLRHRYDAAEHGAEWIMRHCH